MDPNAKLTKEQLEKFRNHAKSQSKIFAKLSPQTKFDAVPEYTVSVHYGDVQDDGSFLYAVTALVTKSHDEALTQVETLRKTLTESALEDWHIILSEDVPH